MKPRISPTWVWGLMLAVPLASAVAQTAATAALTNTASKVSPARPAKVYESPWFLELGKLAQSGIEDRVLFAFVDSAGTFNLRPEQIIRLRDLGVSGDVINAVLQHDSEIALGLRQVPPSAIPPSAPSLQTLLVARPAAPAKPAAAVSPGAPPPPVPASAPSPGPAVSDEGESEIALAPAEPPSLPGRPQEFSPVRKPYPEQLTNPIIMVKAAGRMPNLVVIDMFPNDP